MGREIKMDLCSWPELFLASSHSLDDIRFQESDVVYSVKTIIYSITWLPLSLLVQVFLLLCNVGQLHYKTTWKLTPVHCSPQAAHQGHLDWATARTTIPGWAQTTNPSVNSCWMHWPFMLLFHFIILLWFLTWICLSKLICLPGLIYSTNLYHKHF